MVSSAYLNPQSHNNISQDVESVERWVPHLSKGKTKENAPLADVPAVFFDSGFDLGDPHTFSAVTEQSTAPNSTVNPEDISVNQILQEKLSHYLDIVELHLSNEIQSRSASFFAALSNLQDLQTEGADCLVRIENLRNQLREVDNQIAHKGLNLVRIQNCSSNMRTIETALDSMKEIREMMVICDRLVQEGNWDDGLGLISVLEDSRAQAKAGFVSLDGHSLTNGPSKPIQKGHHFSLGQASVDVFHPPSPHQSPFLSAPTSDSQDLELSHQNYSQDHNADLMFSSRDLLGPSFVLNLASFVTLPSRLGDFNSRITESLLSSLLDVLRDDISSRFTASSSHETDASAQHLRLTQRFIPLWQGLLRTGGVSQALTRYREMVLLEIRICVRKVSQATVVAGSRLIVHSPFLGVTSESRRRG